MASSTCSIMWPPSKKEEGGPGKLHSVVKGRRESCSRKRCTVPPAPALWACTVLCAAAPRAKDGGLVGRLGSLEGRGGLRETALLGAFFSLCRPNLRLASAATSAHRLYAPRHSSDRLCPLPPHPRSRIASHASLPLLYQYLFTCSCPTYRAAVRFFVRLFGPQVVITFLKKNRHSRYRVKTVQSFLILRWV